MAAIPWSLSGLSWPEAPGRQRKPVGALPIGMTVETTVSDGIAVTERVSDPAEAALVERIYGKPWSTRAVRKVIENRDYLGKNGYPQLIDQAVWDRAQRPKRSRGHRLEPAPGG